MQIQLADANRCYGCGACAGICAKQCISMRTNEYGEYRPVLQESSCVHCGKCMEVCPALHNPELRTPASVLALSLTDDAKRKGSASGGAARLLYELALEHGATVFGCDFDSSHVLKMRSANSLEAIEGFRNSKYTFCRTESTFAEARDLLKDGKSVLFIGTSCQIDALQRFVGKFRERLVTVDLICHGVPPEQYLSEYLKKQEIRFGCSISKIVFRGETRDKDYYLQLFSNGTLLYEKYARLDAYFSGYVHYMMFEEKCYDCPYASGRRVSDITIGDWWGKSEITGKKLSLVFANTPKGEAVISMLLKQPGIECEAHTVEEAVHSNEQLQGPSRRPDQHSEMREYYRNNGFWAMSQKYITPYIRKFQWKVQKERLRGILRLPFRAANKLVRIVRKL